jgi:hypothetical protein
MRPVLLVSYALSAALGCAAPQPQPDVERGVLGYVHDGDTTVIEEYTRTATTLHGVVRPQIPGAKFGWARYRVEFSPSGDATRAELAVGPYGTGPESEPRRVWTTTIGNGEIIEVSTAGTIERVRAAGAVVPLFPPSMAMFNEAIRRTHRLSATRGRADVLIYSLASDGELHSATVQWLARDTAAVSYHGGPPLHYAVDAGGRVLSVTDPRDGRHISVRLR